MVDTTTLEVNEHFTGQDAKLTFKTDAGSGDSASKYEIPISNVSWSRDVGTSNVNNNNGLKATKVLTDIDFSGSFEYSGQNWDALNAFMFGTQVGEHESSEPARGTMTVTEEDKSGDKFLYTFKRVIVTSESRDVPSDGASSTSFDWEAEDMVLKHIGSASGSSEYDLPNNPNAIDK